MYNPISQAIDCKESLASSEQYIKFLSHKSRRSKQRVNKIIGSNTFEWNNIGECFMCKTNVGIAPYNTRSGTTYLVPANKEFIAVKMQGWYALYLTNGLLFDSVTDLKERCKFVRASSAEIRRIDKPVVFRAASKVIVRKMNKGDEIKSEAALALVQAAYVKG